MSERILLVDDELNVLEGYRRNLRKQFDLETALGGEEALEAIKEGGPFAVVVADMRMPGMNGIELLKHVKAMAPQTVRMILTGNADQKTAMDAINEGHIFRFLTKPCPPEVLAKNLQAGIEQYRLITAEKELLSKTLSGSLKVIADVLGLVNPTAFGRAGRIQRLARELAAQLQVQNAWQIELAAMLSQIGYVAVPESTLLKSLRGEELSRAEREAIHSTSGVAYDLLRRIPRMEEVARIIRYQDKHFDGGGVPPGPPLGGDLPLGSRILKVAADFDALLSANRSEDIALAEMTDRVGWYDPAVLDALRHLLAIQEVFVIRRVGVAGLVDGAILAEDVRSIHGTLLCAKGQEVTPAMRARLASYLVNVGVQTPIKVFVRASDEGCEEPNVVATTRGTQY